MRNDKAFVKALALRLVGRSLMQASTAREEHDVLHYAKKWGLSEEEALALAARAYNESVRLRDRLKGE